MGEYIIGVDIGTQGTKAALFDSKLHLLHAAFEQSGLISPRPGTVWQEAEEIYGSAMRTIRELMEKSKVLPQEICAVGIDGQMAGIMGIGKDGEASTYYDSWLDTRSNVLVPQMENLAGEEMMLSSGGPVTCNHASKILWWKREHPDKYRETAKFVLPHGYVVNKMAGNTAEEAVFDYTCLHFNSFSDNKGKAWSKELLKLFDIEEDKMPRVASPFEIVGKVTKKAAEECGLAEGTPIAAGAGDSAASAFGSGMFHKDMLQDCAGTASILCSVVDTYVPDIRNRTMVMMRSPVDGLWNPLAYINGGGLCLRWVRDQLSGTPAMRYEELEKEAEMIAPGSEGLLFCPHFSGRVLPNQPKVKGTFWGLDFKHARGHLYRAVMEGIAYEYHYFLSVLRENYPDNHFDSLLTIGGGANSKLFNQIKADVLGLPVRTLEMGETALTGSAVIAAVGAGLLKDYKKVIAENVAERKIYRPEALNQKVYQAGAVKYLKMLNAISTI